MTTAIETEYAGHRFRSRLEARWAVFFDKLGIRWLYEPQGYTLGNGERYLPDFWLPEGAVWVEVKGAAAEADLIKLHAATAADGLPLTYEGGRKVPDEYSRQPIPIGRIVLLGDIPPAGPHAWAHRVTILAGSGPARHDAFFWGKAMVYIGRTRLWSMPPDHFGGQPCPAASLGSRIADAYDAARKARFEHGESGYLKPALGDGWGKPNSQWREPATPDPDKILSVMRAIVDAASDRDLTEEEAERYEGLEQRFLAAKQARGEAVQR